VPDSGDEEACGMSDPSDDRAPFAIDEFPYIQLADRLEDRIRKGEFGEDGKMPVTDELAEWYSASPAVIRHARQELTRRNLVVFRLGHGYFARVTGEQHPG
jgi:DNA-binding GntR family transcriptional regulator